MTKKLNKQQKEAIQYHSGPMLVMAGAGAGKTYVLTHHIMYLIKHYDVHPWNILAVTFTNKAADEMKDRVHQLVPYDTPENISTFHAAGRQILDYTEYHSNININMGNFVPIQPETREELIRDILAKYQQITPKHVAPKYLKEAITAISMAKAYVLTPKRIVTGLHKHMPIVESFVKKYKKMKPGNIYWDVYMKYQEILVKSHELDMDDDLMLPVIILERFPSIRRHFQRLFRYILVDEYQDTNQAQYRMIQLLDERYRNLFAVGDVDQSIYGWRGANIQNIMNFKRDYPNAKIISMRDNYRSTGNIINASNNVIRNNHDLKYKANLATKDDGKKVIVCNASTLAAQANFISSKILSMHKKNHIPYNQFAVLYRLNRQSSPIEASLLQNGIHYAKIQDDNFFRQPIVQTLLHYLYVVSSLNAEPSMSKIINYPKRGISRKTYHRFKEYADSTNQSYMTVLSKIGQVKGISSRGQHALSKFYLQILRWRDYAKQKDATLSGLLKHIVHDSALYTKLHRQLKKSKRLIDRAKYQADLDNMRRVINLASVFDNKHAQRDMPHKIVSLASYIVIHSLSNRIINKSTDVYLMTVHAAKGLQFKVIFMIDMDQGSFPDIDMHADAKKQLRSERRLCYVGMTRAEDYLFMLRPKFVLHGKRLERTYPSQFFREINPKYLDRYSIKQKNGHIKVLKL